MVYTLKVKQKTSNGVHMDNGNTTITITIRVFGEYVPRGWTACTAGQLLIRNASLMFTCMSTN